MRYDMLICGGAWRKLAWGRFWRWADGYLCIGMVSLSSWSWSELFGQADVCWDLCSSHAVGLIHRRGRHPRGTIGGVIRLTCRVGSYRYARLIRY